MLLTVGERLNYICDKSPFQKGRGGFSTRPLISSESL